MAAVVLLIAGWAAASVLNRRLRDVAGTSMVPTLLPGDRVLVLPVTPRSLRRGDVVVVGDPRDPGRETVKRVVGLAGDTLAAEEAGTQQAGTVPAGHVFVAGDHRRGSTDSRAYGPVPVAAVVGRVRWRLRPWGPVT